ncbi:uncharacterized protein FIBRA_08149 [Fibroporia radiculosa]|uniref:Glucose-methanol-choline oxidoreductase N-terminal domain-containing protein n=1 Tax=Fibroporia radiculosa TaxID=599839 RepID=J4IC73_9APHY|nr:uncharacterized protein FIBRA_08149 [Fibroporia radiculosa]CCM05911.1 predicted protein [Fibroporia radiculosa]
MTCQTEELEVDIIVAGGGTAGCVIAGRLATADPTLTILVIEAGQPTREELPHIQPARFLSHSLPGSLTMKRYVGRKCEQLGGRCPVVPCGECLGGGSSVNFMMYNRPSKSDFDDWETVYGNTGWGSKDLLPLFQKARTVIRVMETYQVENDRETHGYSGPIQVSYGGHFTTWGQEFLNIASRYDKKRISTNDPNGMRPQDINAYGRWEKYIGAENGRRSDVPHHYLFQKEFRNLTIRTGHLVKRVLFEGNRAVGVEYLPNPRLHAAVTHKVHSARARQMVIVSAGALASPTILERSGIGSGVLLHSLGIETIVDLPGVGENYQGLPSLISNVHYSTAHHVSIIDHNVLFVPYNVDQEVETLDGIVQNDEAELEKWSAQWTKDGSGLMSHNGIDGGVKLRPLEEELDQLGPEFEQRWTEYFANAPDKPVMWLGCYALYMGDPSLFLPGKYCSIGCFLHYPDSVGHIHATSADDMTAPPDFDPNFLVQPGDIALLRWGYKHGRELARRMPSYRGEFAPSHPTFSCDSPAACQSQRHPINVSDPNIDYTTEDDRAIDEYIRKVVATTWHSLGTCAMIPRDKGGVVDSNLDVYGVEGLKVADLSIAPANVSANTYSTALVVGEKASEIVMRELGIGGMC